MITEICNRSFSMVYEDFVKAAKEFVELSEILADGWKLGRSNNQFVYIKKETFVNINVENNHLLLKAEYVIFYSNSYNVPMFSFNLWNSNGVLLSIEEIRQISMIEISKEDFLSVITQQEHPLFFRPFFIVHPCNMASLLTNFKTESNNLLVTFMSLISPLVNLRFPLEYAALDNR